MFYTVIGALLGIGFSVLAVLVFIGVLPASPAATAMLAGILACDCFKDAYTRYKENKVFSVSSAK